MRLGPGGQGGSGDGVLCQVSAVPSPVSWLDGFLLLRGSGTEPLSAPISMSLSLSRGAATCSAPPPAVPGGAEGDESGINSSPVTSEGHLLWGTGQAQGRLAIRIPKWGTRWVVGLAMAGGGQGKGGWTCRQSEGGEQRGLEAPPGEMHVSNEVQQRGEGGGWSHLSTGPVTAHTGSWTPGPQSLRGAATDLP